jgi:hypothetical protein
MREEKKEGEIKEASRKKELRKNKEEMKHKLFRTTKRRQEYLEA